MSTNEAHTDGISIQLNNHSLGTANHNGIKGEDGLTLTVLGCGTMGTSVLSGILSAISSPGNSSPPSPSPSGTATPSTDPPSRIPTRFIACVRRPATAKRINNTLISPIPVEIFQNENLRGVEEADVVLLGCKPANIQDVLGERGMKEALKGKLLISILAGVPVSQLEETLYGSVSNNDPESEGRCRIVRVLPNTASLVRESMTVIGTSTPPLPEHYSTLLTWMFTHVGRVVHLPPYVFDAATALCGSGPAFLALILEAIADGAVAMGLPRAEAQLMAAQTMKGTAALVLNGEHPALVREKVSTPGGCTIGGLMVLEEGKARGTMARAVREATVVASQLGKGVQGVNGTRF